MNMGSTPYPRTWIPYVNTKDCSQGICSLHCPQWCYIIFPPPPPFDFPDENDSSTSFSPLVIAIIGILGSAFLLVSYYAIISKYCRNRESSSSRRRNHVPSMELEENQDPSYHGPWHVSGNGLDESLIKSITMFKYKKEDGLIEGVDCSICLSEFQEDESLRLLPRCSHAFHVTCIDPWFKSHSNCPLCRTIIVSIDGSPPPVMEDPSENDNSQVAGDIEMGLGRQEIVQSDAPTTQERARNVAQNVENYSRAIDDRGDEEHLVRRSASMDNPFQPRVSIADILHTSDDEDYHIEESEFQGDVGPSKDKSGEMSNSNIVLQCVKRPVGMKRSFSSGRFTFSNRARGKSTILPL